MEPDLPGILPPLWCPPACRTGQGQFWGLALTRGTGVAFQVAEVLLQKQALPVAMREGEWHLPLLQPGTASCCCCCCSAGGGATAAAGSLHLAWSCPSCGGRNSKFNMLTEDCQGSPSSTHPFPSPSSLYPLPKSDTGLAPAWPLLLCPRLMRSSRRLWRGWCWAEELLREEWGASCRSE